MTIFLFKKPELTLDCFTPSGPAYQYSKIENASKYIPEWWKNTPNETSDSNPTIKWCNGFIDYYKTGIVIPSWFEAEITVNPNSSYNVLTTDEKSFKNQSNHPNKMFSQYSENDTFNIKIMSPWIFKMKENINFVWSEPTWDNKNLFTEVTVLPGVMNFKYNTTTNINLLIKVRKDSYKINIKPQQPLAMLHALTDKKIIIKTHLVSQEEYNNLDSINRMFLWKDLKSMVGVAKGKRKIIDKVDEIESQQSKCPFGFGRK